MTASSGTRGLRVRKQARLREALRRTSIRLFIEHGFDGIAVGDIAAANEVSPGTVCRYFPTKADIVLATKRAQIAAVPSVIGTRAGSDPPFQLVRSTVRDWHATLEADELALDVERLIATNPELTATASALRCELCGTLAQTIVQRFPGTSAEVDAAVHAIAAVWPAYAARKRWTQEGGRRPLTAIVEAAYRAVDAAARIEALSEPARRAEDDTLSLADEVRAELSGLRQRKAFRLRTQLKEVAIRLFSERGFHATTIDDIVAQADVSKRTFFRYYRAKEDVLLEGPLARGDRLHDVVMARPASEDPMTAARHGVWILITATYGKPSQTMLDFSALLTRRTELRPQLMKIRNYWSARLGEALAKRMGCAPDALEPNAIATTVLWAGFDALDRWSADPNGPTVGERIDQSFAALYRTVTKAAAVTAPPQRCADASRDEDAARGADGDPDSGAGRGTR